MPGFKRKWWLYIFFCYDKGFNVYIWVAGGMGQYCPEGKDKRMRLADLMCGYIE